MHACVARFGSSLRKFAPIVILAVNSVLLEFVCGAWNWFGLYDAQVSLKLLAAFAALLKL